MWIILTKSTTTEQDSDIAPVQEPDNIKTHDIMCKIVTVDEISKSYSDQTGKFPITSSRGNKYVFVFYHYDTNVILGYALKSRNTTDICAAWNIAWGTKCAHTRQWMLKRDENNVSEWKSTIPISTSSHPQM